MNRDSMNSDVMELAQQFDFTLAERGGDMSDEAYGQLRRICDSLSAALNAQAPVAPDAWLDADGDACDLGYEETRREFMRNRSRSETLRPLYLAPPSDTALQARVARLEEALRELRDNLTSTLSLYGCDDEFIAKQVANATAALASEVQS